MRKAFYLSAMAAGVTASLLVASPAVASAGDNRFPGIAERAPMQSTYPWCEFEWYCDDDDLGVLLDEGPSRPNQDLPDRERPDRDRPDRDRPDRDRPDRDRGGRG